MSHSPLIARAAFPPIQAAQGDGDCRFRVVGREGRGIATVIARRDCSARLAEVIRARYGVELPRGPRRACARGIAFAGVGVETWLATRDDGGNDFALELKEELGSLASVSDQTDAYAILELSGLDVRDVLASLLSVDLHPRALEVGRVASTAAAYCPAICWRLEDRPESDGAFEIAVYRSYAGGFVRSLSAAAHARARS